MLHFTNEQNDDDNDDDDHDHDELNSCHNTKRKLTPTVFVH